MSRKTKMPTMTYDDLLQEAARGNHGVIIRYYRCLRGWYAWQLAFAYAQAMRAAGLADYELITDNWIICMETKNKVPEDPMRRWILASLLDIPPLLLGLQSSDNTVSMIIWERVDLQEYRTTLEEYCRGWHTRSAFQAVNDIKRRIDNLRDDIDYYRNDPARKEKRALLCGYYLIFGEIVSAYADCITAIKLFSQAIEIAQQEQFYDLWCHALRQRGNIYKYRSELTALSQGYAVAQPDFQQALLNYEQAQQLSPKNVPDVYKGLVALVTGSAYTSTGQSADEALEIVDIGSKQIGKKIYGSKVPIAAILDEERYHLSKSRVYLFHPVGGTYNARMARSELAQSEKHTIHSLARDAERAIYFAQSYLIEKKYNEATFYTQKAIAVVRGAGLAHLQAIYQALRKSSYGNSHEVAILGFDLLKAHKPTLFK